MSQAKFSNNDICSNYLWESRTYSDLNHSNIYRNNRFDKYKQNAIVLAKQIEKLLLAKKVERMSQIIPQLKRLTFTGVQLL